MSENKDCYVDLKNVVKRMRLETITPEVSIEDIVICQTEVNRPALQLAGFFDYFDSERIQVVGMVEHTYLSRMSKDKRQEVIDKLFSHKIPCLIVSRNLEIFDELKLASKKYKIAVFRTRMSTSYFNSELNRYLKRELAPSVSAHGGLIDVYGEGVLITGESGVGKSETALELIKRGHRLVADDVVEIKKVSDEELIGKSPDIIRHFIELRGIGIVDCKMLFGVESVKEENQINLVIKLEEWKKGKEYDRIGLTEEHEEILGIRLPCNTIPIKPGRNIALIVESAAINYRQKTMGYNAAIEINRRVQRRLDNKPYNKYY